jgi:hypothetical protein
MDKVTFIPDNVAPPRISHVQARALVSYVKMLLEWLDLTDWRVYIQEQPSTQEGATATMRSANDANTAQFWLSDHFFHPDMDAEHRSQVLVHECLHLHFDRAWNFLEDAIEEEMPTTSRGITKHVFKTQMEIGIDRLAWVIAPNVPRFELPDVS